MSIENVAWAAFEAVLGYFSGLRTNYVVGRAFEYRAFLHKAMIEVRLMSERLCWSSNDLTRVPRVDSVVRLCADQIDYLGQKRVANLMRVIEHEIVAKFHAAAQSATDIHFREEKNAWIQQLESLRPNWIVFFRRQKLSRDHYTIPKAAEPRFAAFTAHE
jgi:hypothetical protein